MIGREFLDSAKTLAQSQKPCDLRSAVSRAYYASYHASLEMLQESGVRFPSGTSLAHTKMPQCLENTNADVATKVGRQLRSLRDDRNAADYDMSDTLFEDQVSVSDRVIIAERIIALIDSVAAQPSDYRNLCKLLAASAKKLGLHVV